MRCRLILMRAAAILPVVMTVFALRAQEPVPVGSEFQIDSSSSQDSRDYPAIAIGPSGEFIVLWRREVSSNDQRIVGRRFFADGTPNGSRFRVDSETTRKSFPALAALPNGNYIVAWEELAFRIGMDNSGNSVRAKIYGSTGEEFQVNTFTDLHQGRPAVAVFPDGKFVIVWQSDGSNGSDQFASSIQGQMYNANGTRSGSEFQVNTFVLGDQMSPAVAAGSSGFVVAWTSSQSDGDGSKQSIRARRFDVAGQPLGDDFQVNNLTTGSQFSVDLVVGSKNDFFAVWTSGEFFLSGPDGSHSSIQGRRYDSSGVPLGGEFQINTQVLEDQGDPAIARGGNGDFCVVWFDRIEPGDNAFLPGGVRGQLFNADGTRQGTEFRVNNYIPNAQDSPDIATGNGGDFFIVWRSVFQNADDSTDIFGRRFWDPGSLFEDGFESGNTSSWN